MSAASEISKVNAGHVAYGGEIRFVKQRTELSVLNVLAWAWWTFLRWPWSHPPRNGSPRSQEAADFRFMLLFMTRQ
jgi:hypothetical protein